MRSSSAPPPRRFSPWPPIPCISAPTSASLRSSTRGRRRYFITPHIHCIVPGSGISPDGTRWVKSADDFFLPFLALSRLFRGKFLAFLAEAERAGTLRFAGATAALATPAGFDSFLEEQDSKDWVVYTKPPFGSPEQVLKYLARYTHRVAISDRRILGIHDDGVTFSYRDNLRGPQVMTLGGVEFLRRFLLHVLPTGFVRIRYFGLLANRVRVENLERCRALLAADVSVTVHAPPTEPAAPSPAAEERDRCPYCGVGRLRAVAVLAAIPLLDMDTWAPVPRDTS
jgi:hypothetical protein